jgi:hypothetical protein
MRKLYKWKSPQKKIKSIELKNQNSSEYKCSTNFSTKKHRTNDLSEKKEVSSSDQKVNHFKNE